MNDTHDHDRMERFNRLRDKAVGLLKNKPEMATASGVEIEALINELSITQQELILQNELLMKSENEMTKISHRFEDLYENAPCGYITLNHKGTISRTNKKALELLGNQRIKFDVTLFSSFIESGWDDLYYDTLRKTVNSKIKQSIELKLKSGSPKNKWIQTEIEAAYNEGKQRYQWRLALIDITSKKFTENALHNSEAKYRSIMESTKDPTYICSLDHRIEYMNPAMIKWVGGDRTGDICYKAFHKRDSKCPECPLGEIKKGNSIYRDIISPLDNKKYSTSHSPIVQPDGTISKLTVYRDISELIELEERLQKVQKLESIGTLAGGIAHDFNNILYPIIGFAEMSLGQLPKDHPVQENLEDILAGANRAKDLVKQILLFSSQTETDQHSVTLQPIINEVLRLLRSTIPKNIEFKVDLYDGTDYIWADPSKIHEIVMNLCTNAYHAMGETGGVLTIKLDKCKPSLEFGLPQGDYCCLMISDTGTGIPDNVLTKIFDPYYTTKKQGKGTGLGLSVVHGIVSSMNGDIKVESSVGEGSIFKVFLPITQKKTISDQPFNADKIVTGNEEILFVDDERVIVKLAVRVFEGLGYSVTGMVSSMEALNIFKLNPDKFDIVITDMAMPNMVGTELSREILKIRPDIPIILCTGFSGAVDKEKANTIGIKEYISKPLMINELTIMTRNLLDHTK